MLLTIIFGILLIWIICKLLIFGIRLAWGVTKILCAVVLLPIILIALAYGGLFIIALPILIVIGLVLLVCSVLS